MRVDWCVATNLADVKFREWAVKRDTGLGAEEQSLCFRFYLTVPALYNCVDVRSHCFSSLVTFYCWPHSIGNLIVAKVTARDTRHRSFD
jgi:hypothetical protein